MSTVSTSSVNWSTGGQLAVNLRSRGGGPGVLLVLLVVGAVLLDLTGTHSLAQSVGLCLVSSVHKVKQSITLGGTHVFCQGRVCGKEGLDLVVDQASQTVLVMVAVLVVVVMVASRGSLGQGHCHQGTQGEGYSHGDDVCVWTAVCTFLVLCRLEIPM